MTILWQSVGVLATAFGASFLLKETGAETTRLLDVVATVIVAGAAWVWAQALDTSTWCNRNLQIIANIEEEFLAGLGRSRIHPYVGYMRKNRMLMPLLIQATLPIAIGLATLILHFCLRVYNTLNFASHIDWSRTAPYIALVVGLAGTFCVWHDSWNTHERLLKALGHIPEQRAWRPWPRRSPSPTVVPSESESGGASVAQSGTSGA
jgi:hypothetical protein